MLGKARSKEKTMAIAATHSDRRGIRMRRTWGSALALVAAAIAFSPAGALAAPGDILIADMYAFGGTGGVIRVDPQTGARTAVSANGAPAGGPAFVEPAGIALDAGGDILVADWSAFGGTGGVIRVDPQTGARTAVSANGAPTGGPAFQDPAGIALEADGDILVADSNAFGGTGGVIRVDPQTGARTAVSANGAPAGGPAFQQPSGIALGADGSILVADYFAFGGSGGVIRVDPQTGARTTLSANGAPAGGPAFQTPAGMVLGADGDILVADWSAFGATGGVIRVDPQTGARTTVSANGAPAGGPNFSDPGGVALAADGDILVADADVFGGPGGVIRVDPQTGARTTLSASGAPAGGPNFNQPWSIAVEAPPAPPAAPATPVAPAQPTPLPVPPPADTLAPRLSGASLTNRRFRVGRRAKLRLAARVPIGTRFRYTLSEPAAVEISIERALPGRRVGGRCLRPSRALRSRPRCTRLVARGAFTAQGRAGANRTWFSGRIGRRALPAGSYRARLTATDAAGNRSVTQSVRFKIVGR
jgi:glutamate synthase domain-containing protein 3